MGVVDLLAGRAVHAVAGRREHYAPVTMVGGSAIEEGDATALARAYVERLGVMTLYAADLDAILGRGSQDALVSAVADIGAPLWLDSGITSPEQARQAIAGGAARVIVGLETLRSYEQLEAICQDIGAKRVAFSIDLREGEPIVTNAGFPVGQAPHVIAKRAADAGAGALIVLDLARVGTRTGLDLAMVARVREAAPHVVLIAGGGVRGLDDLAHLAAAGCDGALVATALQNGRLSAADVATAQHLDHGRSTR